jgi:hypothetical protein
VARQFLARIGAPRTIQGREVTSGIWNRAGITEQVAETERNLRKLASRLSRTVDSTNGSVSQP